MTHPKFKALLLDMDGVLWRDTQPIGDLPALLAQIESLGLRTAFVTNNATKTAPQFTEKFAGFGAQVDADLIFSSARTTAEHLAQKHPRGGAVFIVGEQGLVDALKQRGFTHGEQDVLAVVVGLDRAITYEKLTTATLLIRRGTAFIGTNPDVTLPSPAGLAPGAGALIAALEAASGRQAQIIGKPQAALLESALAHLGLEPTEALMVGDRLETDIAAGQAAGCPTALVLTGASTRSQAEDWQPPIDYIAEDLEHLLQSLRANRP